MKYLVLGLTAIFLSTCTHTGGDSLKLELAYAAEAIKRARERKADVQYAKYFNLADLLYKKALTVANSDPSKASQYARKAKYLAEYAEDLTVNKATTVDENIKDPFINENF